MPDDTRAFRISLRIILAALTALLMLNVVLWLSTEAPARERYPGQYAQVDPATSQWFKDQQVPGRGYSCCSLADGTKAEEDIRQGKIFTRFTYTRHSYADNSDTEEHSDWIEVPDEAIIRDGKPNPMGGPVVWYYTEGMTGEVVKIRCFKPADEY